MGKYQGLKVLIKKYTILSQNNIHSTQQKQKWNNIQYNNDIKQRIQLVDKPNNQTK